MTGKIHHLNCGTLTPLGSQLLYPPSAENNLNLPLCHCLLVETSRGLVLIDSGIGRQDIERTEITLGKLRPMVTQPTLLSTECAIIQIERLGYSRDDVRHIVLTHMDFLQTGGLSDFPNATIHVFRKEYQAAQSPQTLLETYRYAHNHWRHSTKWVLHTCTGGLWNGFDFAPVFPESDQILLIDLPGHSRGHAGVAIQTSKGWLLHCGDSIFTQSQLTDHLTTSKRLSLQPFVPTVVSSLLDSCRADRIHTLKRLQQLTRSEEHITMVCSLDPNQFYQCRFQKVSDKPEVPESQMTFPLQAEAKTEEALA